MSLETGIGNPYGTRDHSINGTLTIFVKYYLKRQGPETGHSPDIGRR